MPAPHMGFPAADGVVGQPQPFVSQPQPSLLQRLDEAHHEAHRMGTASNLFAQPMDHFNNQMGGRGGGRGRGRGGRRTSWRPGP